jgi:uncharacterized membrane protein (DUF4010 family)
LANIAKGVGEFRLLSLDETLFRVGLALAIGLLVGIERGWRTREEEAGERTAGLRTFALIGLSGGVWALLARELDPVVLAAGFLGMAGALTLFRWRETQHEKTFGATTLVAGFLTFALGAYAVLGDMTVAAAAGVATMALLAAKEWLHAGLKVLTWPEIRSAVILLAMTFVVLPILPDQGFGPYEAFNPYSLWLMTIVIACVSFAGYVAVRVAGEKYGPLITGIAGGVVSSTATTLDLARRSREAPDASYLLLIGALAASAVMFVRVAVIVGLFGPGLLPDLSGPLAAAAVVTITAALVIRAGTGGERQASSTLAYENPFDLKAVLGFAVLLAVVLFLSKAFTERLGEQGGVALAAVTGIADVDAITLSMIEVAGSSIGAGIAALSILVAVASNSISKSVLAIIAGSRRFGLAYLAVSIAAIVAGGLVALAGTWTS